VVHQAGAWEKNLFFTFQYRKNYPPVSKEDDKLEVPTLPHLLIKGIWLTGIWPTGI
jgi:hypothetical protein